MEIIGLDLHRTYCQICELGESGMREYRVRTTPEDLANRFGGRSACRILIEAATESEWVARLLERLGHEVIVADPNFAPMYATRSSRVKTDRRDARTLADACRLGAYRPCHRLSDESRRIRSRVLVREALVQNRTRSINLSRALLRQQGTIVPSGSTYTFARRTRCLELEPTLAATVEPLLQSCEFLSQQILQEDRYLAELVERDEELRRLCSVPEIGPVTAATYVTTLDDPARFSSARQVGAFLGTVPREFSSGEKLRRGSITKVGNRRTRVLLVEAAWRIWRSKSEESEELRQWAQRIALRRGQRRAIVALARRLAGLLWAIWRDGSEYMTREEVRLTASA
jgi:transposase